MARQGINTGSAPDAGDGDSLLIGALKINANFSEIYTTLGDGNNITNSIGFASTSGISTYSNLSRVIIKDSGSTVGTAGTINFGSNLSVSFASGIATVSGASSVSAATTAYALAGTPNLNVGVVTASQLNIGSGTTLSSSGLSINNNITIYGDNRVIDFLANTTDADLETGIRWYESDPVGQDPRLAIDYNGDSSLPGSGQLEIKGYNTNTSSYNILAVINRNGGVGIGTTNPTSALTVVGSGNFSGNLSVSGVSTFTRVEIPTATSSLVQNIQNKLILGNDLNIFSTSSNNWILADENPLLIGVVVEDGGPVNEAFFGLVNIFPSNDVYYGNDSYVSLGFGTEGTKLRTLGVGVTVTGTTFTNQLSVSGVSTCTGSVRVGVDTSAGVILTSPNGTKYQLFVEDDGTLNTAAV